MRIVINEPDGRLSGIFMGETIGVNYDEYFKFKELNGRTGEETQPVIQEALEKVSADRPEGYEGQIRDKLSGTLANLLDLAKKNPSGTWKVS